jgi:hypothetical protein
VHGGLLRLQAAPSRSVPTPTRHALFGRR